MELYPLMTSHHSSLSSRCGGHGESEAGSNAKGANASSVILLANQYLQNWRKVWYQMFINEIRFLHSKITVFMKLSEIGAVTHPQTENVRGLGYPPVILITVVQNYSYPTAWFNRNEPFCFLRNIIFDCWKSAKKWYLKCFQIFIFITGKRRWICSNLFWIRRLVF